VAKAQDTYAGYAAKDDIEKLLVEATANENWNLSNSKLLELSDASYNMENSNKIADFLLLKLSAKGPEWRRVLKSLNAIDFLLKNGSPMIV
jgi:uncharacterized protein YpuA (DUF1002 family)